MRVIIEGGHPVVVLSRRNLLSLLAKLDGHPPMSTCTLIGGDEAPDIRVRAQEDDIHYAKRPAGPMHPDTEERIRKE